LTIGVELVRSLVGLLLIILMIATFVRAIKRFASSKEAPPTHYRFAAVSLLCLALAGLFRGTIEGFLAGAAEPLNRIVGRAAADWPGEALVGLFRTLATVLGAVLLIQLIGRVYWMLVNRLRRLSEQRDGTSAYLSEVGLQVVRVLRVAALAGVIIGCIPLFMTYFPRSRLLVATTWTLLGNPGSAIAFAIISYLPDLAYLTVVLVLGRYVLKAIHYFFSSLESGSLTISGFHRDWAMPSYRLARTLFLLFLLMVSYPYLPGSKSEAFHGFSVFLGLLVTFGSSGAIGNIFAGTVLTYARQFKLGDMIAIGDHKGIVIEKSLLVTRLLTVQNEEVTIPNTNVIAASVVNYSARADFEGVVLSVPAGIGYDVDWRTVHRLMIEGALATEHIIRDPLPTVWQSQLGDYAVQYELRAATRKAADIWEIHSTLRRNVLDAFNREGVEIMTPSIFAHRNATQLAVPAEQFPDNRQLDGIAVDVRTHTEAPSSGAARA
jgi:small-conductance mechanosensitive channel